MIVKVDSDKIFFSCYIIRRKIEFQRTNLFSFHIEMGSISMNKVNVEMCRYSHSVMSSP